jgi:hypothetical protein
VPCSLIFICCKSSASSSSICHMSAQTNNPIAMQWLQRRTLGVGFSSCASRNVRSLTARVSSRLVFCFCRKRNAILRGEGSFPARTSGYDGGGRRGCSLRPGPGSCYLDGDDIQAIAGEINILISALLMACRGAMWFVVQQALCYSDAVARERRRHPCRASARGLLDFQFHSPTMLVITQESSPLQE